MSYDYIENKEKIKLLDSYYNNFSFNPEINYDYNNNYIMRKSFNKSFSFSSFISYYLLPLLFRVLGVSPSFDKLVSSLISYEANQKLPLRHRLKQ